VGGVECDSHIRMPEEVCDGTDFASYKCKLGPVTVVVIGSPVGCRGVLVST
jgi:hypothetical protein